MLVDLLDMSVFALFCFLDFQAQNGAEFDVFMIFHFLRWETASKCYLISGF